MSFAIAALTFGVVAGMKPGPLGVFIIHQTLSRGPRAGFFASLAPFLTDGPIILTALLLSFSVGEIETVQATLSLLGGLYLVWLAIKLLRTPASVNPQQGSAASSVLSAVKINALNPSPYLFWFTIGGSYILSGTTFEAATFILVALTSLCLTKFLVSLAIRRVGQAFNEVMFALIIKSLAVPLFFFAVQLLYVAFDFIMV